MGTVTPMKGGWLEHEIRSLPQVLACSITPDDVVVMVQPSADPVAVEREVRDVLRRAGTDTPVRVFGGDRPMFAEPVKVRSGRSALVGSIGGAAILAAGVWLAGATTGLRGPKSKAPVTLLAPPKARQAVTLPVVGGDGAETPLIPQGETQATGPLLKPLRPAKFGVTITTPQAARPPATRPPASRPPAPQPEPEAACRAPHAGAAPKAKHGRGNGPPSWSHSIHNAPHCSNGRTQ